jgi:hypothetical protein
MIVIISHPSDSHATVVTRRLEALGGAPVLLDIGDFPERATISVDYATREPRVVFHHVSKGSFELTKATSVWWRRPQAPSLAAITEQHAYGFAHGEWNEALNGLYHLVRCPWMNNPVRDEVASRKPLQLVTARELGFKIPRTLMTSDPNHARAFIAELGVGRTIFKTFSATHQVWRETRLVSEKDLDLLDSLRLAPAIFQEYIPAKADVRVCMVGEKLFAMQIDTRRTSYEVDFRVSLHESATSPIDLPQAVQDNLRKLMRHYALSYGAVDLRLGSDGDFVFLEINPAGEFLFVENNAGLPVTDAVASWLLEPHSDARG